MAGAGIKEIKTRINSVNSTKQVTKAMELVASSKMRKAKDRALAARPYFGTMYNTVKDIATNTRGVRNVFLKQREVKNRCYIVVAGDRGLAGGYNSNITKLTLSHMDGKKEKVMTVGKKSTEFFSKRGYDILKSTESVEKCDYNEAIAFAQEAMDLYKKGEIDEVVKPGKLTLGKMPGIPFDKINRFLQRNLSLQKGQNLLIAKPLHGYIGTVISHFL